jgi:hypothetical protein
VRSVAHGPEAIKRWNSERSRKISVRAAAGGSLVDRKSHIACDCLSVAKKLLHASCPLERRAVDPAANLNLCAF